MYTKADYAETPRLLQICLSQASRLQSTLSDIRPVFMAARTSYYTGSLLEPYLEAATNGSAHCLHLIGNCFNGSI